MIELVEVLGQLVTVVGNAARTVVLARQFNDCSELIELLNEYDFFIIERHFGA